MGTTLSILYSFHQISLMYWIIKKHVSCEARYVSYSKAYCATYSGYCQVSSVSILAIRHSVIVNNNIISGQYQTAEHSWNMSSGIFSKVSQSCYCDSQTGVVKHIQMGLGQAEQPHTIIVDMYSCLYSYYLAFNCMASVDVSVTTLEKFGTHKTTDR